MCYRPRRLPPATNLRPLARLAPTPRTTDSVPPTPPGWLYTHESGFPFRTSFLLQISDLINDEYKIARHTRWPPRVVRKRWRGEHYPIRCVVRPRLCK